MAAFLGPRYGSGFSGVPARISGRDYPIWVAWWPLVRESVSAVYFDVGLGAGAPVPVGTEAALAAMWLRNTQKRADVVAVVGDAVWIVELRSGASSSAVGRLLQYRLLWQADPPLPGGVVLVLVTDTRDGEVAALAQSVGVVYTVVDVSRVV